MSATQAFSKRMYCRVYAGELLRDVAEKFWDDADFHLTVTDENGLILFTMRMIGIEAPAIRQRRSPVAELN